MSLRELTLDELVLVSGGTEGNGGDSGGMGSSGGGDGQGGGASGNGGTDSGMGTDGGSYGFGVATSTETGQPVGSYQTADLSPGTIAVAAGAITTGVAAGAKSALDGNSVGKVATDALSGALTGALGAAAGYVALGNNGPN